MSRRRLAALPLAAITMLTIGAPMPLHAQTGARTELSGRCEYSDRVARFRHETALIVCDTASIERNEASATFDFRQRSWGSMARFSGPMEGNTMAVARVTLRDGRSVAATGTCEIVYRDNGQILTISCLARAGSRSVAANFVPSRL
jgi:hypothetical protein